MDRRVVGHEDQSLPTPGASEGMVPFGEKSGIYKNTFKGS